jgi:hypothetical protein
LAGKDPTELIESVDGFHPSGTGNMLLAARMWEWLEKNVPDALGVENPYNDHIEQLFGNQGGYE